MGLISLNDDPGVTFQAQGLARRDLHQGSGLGAGVGLQQVLGCGVGRSEHDAGQGYAEDGLCWKPAVGGRRMSVPMCNGLDVNMHGVTCSHLSCVLAFRFAHNRTSGLSATRGTAASTWSTSQTPRTALRQTDQKD